MSHTDKLFKLANRAGVAYQIYTGNKISKGNGQGGCYWSGKERKLFVWDKVKDIDIAHELGHYFAVDREEQFSLDNYGLDLLNNTLFESKKQERNACLLHFHLCDIFGVPKDEIKTDMDNCSFLNESTFDYVLEESADYSIDNQRNVIELAKKIQGEYDALYTNHEV